MPNKTVLSTLPENAMMKDRKRIMTLIEVHPSTIRAI